MTKLVMSRFAGFLSDYDGTLADTTEPHLLARVQAFRELGYSPDKLPEQEIRSGEKYGASLYEIVAGLLRSAGLYIGERNPFKNELVSQIVERKKEILQAAIRRQPPRAFKGALKKCRTISNQLGVHACGVVTSASEGEFAAFKNARSFTGVFGYVIGEHTQKRHGKRPKPDPGPYLLAAEILKINLSDTLVAEDSPTGIASARAAGAEVLALCYTTPARVLANLPSHQRPHHIAIGWQEVTLV